MIKTYGLTHIALAVRDSDESLRFYEQLFGLQEYFRDEISIHARNPNGHEIVTFVRDPLNAGRPGGVLHFGFRLPTAQDMDGAVHEIEQAGGRFSGAGSSLLDFRFSSLQIRTDTKSRFGLSEDRRPEGDATTAARTVPAAPRARTRRQPR
jgi:catechol 2,3-dioxygenase-like lactoylglutathione lyase family enzyme